jgi:hypothetical protein
MLGLLAGFLLAVWVAGSVLLHEEHKTKRARARRRHPAGKNGGEW